MPKRQIPALLKDQIWETYVGKNKGMTKCKCCQSVEISKSSFHAGHIVSERNGGAVSVGNLRPVCGRCNQSMGTKNMIDFMIEHDLNCINLSNKDEDIENETRLIKEEEERRKINVLEEKVRKLEMELMLYKVWKEVVLQNVPKE